MANSNTPSEAIVPIVTKFYVKPAGAEGKRMCSNGLGPMTTW